MKSRIETAHCLMALNAGGEGSSRTINLLPAPLADGTIPGRDGRFWRLLNPAAVIEASNAHAASLGAALDEGHRMFQAPDAPAFGWFLSYALNSAGGIDGLNELTNLGLDAITQKHYRFASVVFDFNPDTKEILLIKGAGLTNNQNLHVQALNSKLSASAGENQKEKAMLEALLTALGLPMDTPQEQAVNAIKGLQTAQTALNTQGSVVPKAEFDRVETALNATQSEMAALKASILEEKIETALNAALTARKITPPQKVFFENQIKTEEALNAFQTEFVAKAPVMGADVRGLNGAGPDAETALNAAAVELGRVFGNSVEDLKKYGK